MQRRSFLRTVLPVLAFSLTAFTGGVAIAQENTKIDIRLGFIANVQNADLFIAIDHGIFAENGMDVNLIAGGPGSPNALTELAARNVQIALGNWDAFTDAIVKGNDFVLIGTQFQSSPLGVLSLADDPILEVSDLQGATILAQGKGAESWVRAVLTGASLDPDSVEFQPTGFSPEPLLQGDGKGYTAFGTNQAVTLEIMGQERGKDFHFRSFDDLGASTIAGLFVVEREYLEANREMLVKFIASLVQAQRISEKDVTIGAALATDKFGIDYGLDLDQQVLQNTRQLEYIRPGADMAFQLYSLDEDKISGPMMKTLGWLGRTELPENILDHVDTSIVTDAYEMLGN